MIINEIKSSARETSQRNHEWDRQKREEVFQRYLRNKVEYPPMPDMPLASNASFEHPAFNILTGNTNYTLRDIASDRRNSIAQMELFDRRQKMSKA
jgi:hypothetical protein